jgi:hypothetical protein
MKQESNAFNDMPVPTLATMLVIVIFSFVFGMKVFAYHDVMEVIADARPAEKMAMIERGI